MIGKRLAQLRKDRDLDQKQLAALLDCTFHTISSYERDRSEPNHEALKKIAVFFDISVDFLLGLTDAKLSYKHNEDVILLSDKLTEEQKKQIRLFANYVTTTPML